MLLLLFIVAYVLVVIYCLKLHKKGKLEMEKWKEYYQATSDFRIFFLVEESKELGMARGEYSSFVTKDKFCVVSKNKERLYIDIPLDDVLGYEKLCEIENKGISIGKAVVGGVLFGGAGAVLGGLMGKSNKKEEVILLINYKGKEVLLVLHKTAIDSLKLFMPDKQAKPSKQTNIQGSKSNQTTISQSNSYDELEQLAQLRDKGIITEDEFSAKKKQILGL